MNRTAGITIRWTYLAGPENPEGGFTDAQWAVILREAKVIISTAASKGISVAGSSGTGKPALTAEHILLNGDASKGEEFETFYLVKTPSADDRRFHQQFLDTFGMKPSREVARGFCKTNGNPYEAVVTSILAVANKVGRGVFKATSDAGAVKRVFASRLAEGLEDACWDGYGAVGMKEQEGRQVPNCVPTKTAAGFPQGFDMTENPLQTLNRVPGFQAVSDTSLSTKNRAFGIVPTNTLSAHQLSQIKSIAPRDTVALLDKYGMALWVGSPADLKLNLKATDYSPWPEVREHAGLAPKTAAHRLDGVRGHQLLPSTLARKLPPIYSQENVEDPLVQVKLFSPYTNAVWYLTEYDPSSNEAFGWADLGYGMGELGYISVSELEGMNRGGLPLVERDTSWRPVPLSQAKKGRMASSRVAQRHTNASTDRVAYEPPFHNAAKADEALGEAYRALVDLKLGFDSWHEVPSSAHPLYQQIMKAVDAVVTARQVTTQVRAMVAKKRY